MGTGRWGLSRVESSSASRSVGSMASACLQRHRNARGSQGSLLDSMGVQVGVGVPATQPALPGEAVSAQWRPGAQLSWEKLADRRGISAIRSSRHSLCFCQSHLEGRTELFACNQWSWMLKPSSQDQHPTAENK